MSGMETDDTNNPETRAAEYPPAPPPAAMPPAAPPAAPLPTAEKSRRPVWPVVFALGFLILAGGEAYLWTDAQHHHADATELAVMRAELDDLRTAMAVQAKAANSNNSTDNAAAQAGLAQQYANLTAQVNAVQAQSANDHAALSQLQANSSDITSLTRRMTLLDALETARLALDAGQPLGQIPNAPPALAQFATTAPPTEAQLRENFPAAARAAEAASLSNQGGTGFWANARMRLEGLITISNGSQVLFGPPAAAALATARRALDDGDLAGAVQALQGMSPAAKQAMGNWLPQAEALLAARAAIVTMAKGS